MWSQAPPLILLSASDPVSLSGVALQGTGKMEGILGEDWTPQTLPSWLHSIWVGIVDPWIVISKGPRIWYKTLREIVTIVRMHQVRKPSHRRVLKLEGLSFQAWFRWLH